MGATGVLELLLWLHHPLHLDEVDGRLPTDVPAGYISTDPVTNSQISCSINSAEPADVIGEIHHLEGVNTAKAMIVSL